MSDNQHDDDQRDGDQHEPARGDADNQSAESKRPGRGGAGARLHDQVRQLATLAAERDRVTRVLEERDRTSQFLEQHTRALQMLEHRDRVSELFDSVNAADASRRSLEEAALRSAEFMRASGVTHDMIALAERTQAIEEAFVRAATFTNVDDKLADAMAHQAAVDDILSAKLRSVFDETSAVDFTRASLLGAAELFSSANAVRTVFDFAGATLFTTERTTRSDFVAELLQRLGGPDVRGRPETRDVEDVRSYFDLGGASIADDWNRTLTTTLAETLAEVDVTRLVRPPAGTAIAGDGAADADAVASLAVDLWRQVLHRLPHLSEGMRVGLLTIIAAILIAAVTTLRAERSAAREDAERVTEHRETQHEIQGVRDAIRESAAREHYVVALRALPLRDDADASAHRTGTVATGTHLAVLERVGRWSYVTPVGAVPEPAVVGPGAADDPPGSGWVYYRNIRPLDAAR